MATTDPGSAQAPPASGAVTTAQPGIQNRTVLLYLVLAVLVLVPGLALRAGFDTAILNALGLAQQGQLAAYLTAFQQQQQDIRFGSGHRFWLGVGGMTMLGLLLLYPIRKVLANRRGVGSVGGWFHLHILLGIAGPVLILYHSNFGHGSLNANVALWTMLLVAISGIIGYFVYGHVSANFYNSRQQAQTHRNAVLASIPESAQFQPRKDLLIAKFEAFEAELLTPRQGFTASIRARLRLERRRREITNDVAGLMVETARSRGDTPAVFQQFRGQISRHVRAYFSIARAAASQSILEQLWSRWRLLHMPVFLIMLVAAILHIVAVWDGSGPDLADADTAGVEVVTEVISARPTATRGSAPVSAGAATAQVQADAAPRPTSPPGLAVRVVKPQVLPTRPSADAASKPLGDTTSSPVAPVPVPKLVRRPAVAKPTQLAANPSTAVNSTDAKVAEFGVESQTAVAEPRRIEAPTMGLGGNVGGVPGRSVDDMFAAFKAKQQAGEFSHSDIETGFGLTGKHLKIECASCHKSPLPATRQTTAVRTCLNCHEKDDNHSGRRPDCAKCHTTNRWKQRIR
jgi:hypothetical protein